MRRCVRGAGLDVLVLEAHGHAGGAAHGFERQGFQFESGPSLWSGLGRWPSNNPLAQILRALDEPLEVISYREWDVLFPEGHLSIGVGADGFEQVVEDLRGAEAVEQWRRFAEVLNRLPPLRMPCLSWHYPRRTGWPGTLAASQRKAASALAGAASSQWCLRPLVDRHLQDPFLRNWVDLLCFLISGMPMADTNAAAMATLFGEWFDPEASLDYPKEAAPRWWPHWCEGSKNMAAACVLEHACSGSWWMASVPSALSW